ncbi:MAG: SPOR domain-containing protein [Deltaproteobacteria bacterium]|jgi:cell division protein FtsN|nr:SPOR domain-containing protein [Deltaproteobacteria bacterium]
MTLTPLSGGLLAVGVFIAALVAWKLTREKKRRVAGSSAPKRFPPLNNRPSRAAARAAAQSTRVSFKAVAIWGTAVVLIGWVVLSLANPGQAPEPSSQAQAQEIPESEAPPDLGSTTISGSLSPPPPPGSIPATPVNSPETSVQGQTPGQGEALPELAIGGVGQGVSAQVELPPNPIRAAGEANIQSAALSISDPALDNAPPLTSFAPIEQAPLPETEEGAITQSAKAMSTGVSRMEPVGRTLINDKDAPQAVKIVAPTAERPRLVPNNPPVPKTVGIPAVPPTGDQDSDEASSTIPTAAPAPAPAPKQAAKPTQRPSSRATAASKPPPLLNPAAAGGPVSYTVLLGSFGKPENAERLRQKMIEAGHPVSVAQVTGKDNKTWYRVMSGTFETQSEADSYGRELKRQSLTDQTFIFKNATQ